MYSLFSSFSFLDGGKHCSVTEQEFGKLLERATGQTVEASEIKRIFEVFDHDNDGKLDYGDCIQFICTQNQLL